MTKYEFLGDLSRLLSDLPEEERRQAMKYYEDYFADAGESQEQAVLKELGSPESVAKLIKDDGSDNIEYGEGSASHIQDFVQPYSSEQSQNAWQNSQQNNAQNDWQNSQQNNAQNAWQNSQQNNAQNGWQNSQQDGQKKQSSFFSTDSGKTALIIIIAILTSPIWGSILVGILSAIVGIASAILGIFAAIIFGGGGVAIGGIGCVIGGIFACITGEVASGILTVGIGCVLFAVGAFFCYLGILLCVKLIPILWQELLKGIHWCSEKINRGVHSL